MCLIFIDPNVMLRPCVLCIVFITLDITHLMHASACSFHLTHAHIVWLYKEGLWVLLLCSFDCFFVQKNPFRLRFTRKVEVREICRGSLQFFDLHGCARICVGAPVAPASRLMLSVAYLRTLLRCCWNFCDVLSLACFSGLAVLLSSMLSIDGYDLVYTTQRDWGVSIWIGFARQDYSGPWLQWNLRKILWCKGKWEVRLHHGAQLLWTAFTRQDWSSVICLASLLQRKLDSCFFPLCRMLYLWCISIVSLELEFRFLKVGCFHVFF